MSDLVRTDKNHMYQTSKNYEELFRMMRETSIVCFVNYRGCRDVAATLSTSGIFDVSARGIAYVGARNKDDFIKQCQSVDLEWIMI